MNKNEKQLQQRQHKKQHSVLREFVPRTHDWLEPERDDEGTVIAPYSISIEDAQEETVVFLEGEKVFDETREKMIEEIRKTETVEKLTKYLYNSLMFWEGDGVD